MLPPMPLARLKGRLWVGLVHVPSSLLGQEEKEEASCLPARSLPTSTLPGRSGETGPTGDKLWQGGRSHWTGEGGTAAQGLSGGLKRKGHVS